ncbi:hypothetical protein HAZT_HAZT001034 [Hyalella azteca]|uniref:Methionyl-tRNA formyltransferase, mitochondrial n=1 Tax=Hyalella azteca TaxID=294128 RepID=A0A6A0H6R9_HYAAZ|nr:hypothetical protein HAZT_HAZT001034 [Hyalella azteca]
MLIHNYKFCVLFKKCIKGIKVVHSCTQFLSNGTVEIQKLAVIASELKHPLRLTFFGTDSFSVKSLRLLEKEVRSSKLISELHVITTKLKHGPSPVESFSVAAGLPVHHWPVSSQNLVATDVGVVVSFGHLIPAEVINAFTLGMLNVHGSLLPAYRGAAPIIHAVLNGETCTGITVMRIHPKRFDVGEILRTASVEVGRHTKSRQLHETLSELGAEHLIEVLRDLPFHFTNARPQPTEGVSYARKISEKHAVVSWNEKSADEIYRQYLALDDHFPLTALWQDNLVQLREAVLPEDATIRVDEGQIASGKGSSVLWVGCANNSIIGFKAIKLKGKKTMSPHEFHNGFMSKVTRDKWYFK